MMESLKRARAVNPVDARVCGARCQQVFEAWQKRERSFLDCSQARATKKKPKKKRRRRRSESSIDARWLTRCILSSRRGRCTYPIVLPAVVAREAFGCWEPCSFRSRYPDIKNPRYYEDARERPEGSTSQLRVAACCVRRGGSGQRRCGPVPTSFTTASFRVKQRTIAAATTTAVALTVVVTVVVAAHAAAAATGRLASPPLR